MGDKDIFAAPGGLTTVAADSLAIVDRGGVALRPPVRTVVGRRIVLQVRSVLSGRLEDIQWTVNGAHVGLYQMSPQLVNGAPVDLLARTVLHRHPDTDREMLTFFWLERGTFEVTVDATIVSAAGVRRFGHATIEVQVLGPALAAMKSETTPFELPDKGTTLTGASITFHCSLKPHAFPCRFLLVARHNYFYQIEDDAQHRSRWGTRGEWVVLANNGEIREVHHGVDRIIDDVTFTTTWPIPGDGSLSDPLVDFWVESKLEFFLMFRDGTSDDGETIWTTIAVLPCRWDARAKRKKHLFVPSYEPWTLSFSTVDNNPSGSQSLRLPEWVKYEVGVLQAVP